MPQQRTQHSGIANGLPYGLRLVIVALLAALLMLTMAGGETHAQSSAPAAPTGLASTSVSHDSVTLSWDDPGDASISGYLVLRRDVVNQAPGTFSTVEPNTGSAATTYTDSTVAAETRYAYRVKAINPEGTSEQSNYVNVETPAAPTPSVPSAPTGLTASSVSHDSVTLSWDDPGDDTVTGYQVLRRSRDGDEYGDGQGAAEFVAITDDTGSSATTYSDTSVEARTRYVYRVKAINSVGMSERSSYLNLETAEEPTPEPTPTPSVPAAPTGLLVSSATHDSVTLTWDDPGDSSVTGHQVLRRSLDRDEYGDGLGSAEFDVVVNDTGSLATTYTDGSVEAGTRYAYAVKARNAQGLGELSTAVDIETSEAPASQPVTGEQTVQPCQVGYIRPTPTVIAVTAVPIVLESTADDYFVLYASHGLDGETAWYPVKVQPGESGTTTLSESVAPLPVERYRVEKYRISDPGDVDGDCVDDVTELNNLGAMNPVNPTNAIEPTHGTVTIIDQEAFETLAQAETGGSFDTKFIIFGIDTGRPRVYFINTNTIQHHQRFADALWLHEGDSIRLDGFIRYDPEPLAPDGDRGLYYFNIDNGLQPFSVSERIYTVLAASMPLLEDNLAFWMRGGHLLESQTDLPLYWASRIHLVFDEDLFGDTSFSPLNTGEGYGLLRSLEPDERPHSRDVVIYEALPNDLPRVAGVISTVPQTPLSHVNLRALQDRVPNAYIADALEDDDITDLIDGYVFYAVTDDGYTIRAATQAEVDEHYASLRPSETQTPQRDLSVTSITPLSDIGFDDWDAFGVKAANVAVLGTLGFPEGTVPDGFAVPFYFYDEFMKHNDLYDDIREMLADPDFQSDYDTKVDELKELRKKIKKAETPEWIIEALTAMHATYPEGQSLRYRSSTNNEDLPGFNGAGLYDSKTQHPEETEEDGISKSLKQVYASLWNFRAFIERDFHRIDHLAAAMGVLVHPNYSDELVNGVAVSTDPAFNTDDTYYVNSQVGEDLVTNPVAHSVPEEVLLYQDGRYTVAALSNQAFPGQLLMTDEQLGQLRRHLAVIHQSFAQLYGVEEGEEFAMEIEFKITSDAVLAIKQARPWIFSGPPPALDNPPAETPGIPLTASFEDVPTTHDNTSLTIGIRFSGGVTIGFEEFRDYALTVTGGSVIRASRVDRRRDLWTIVIMPDYGEQVSISLIRNLPCAAVGAICTHDGRRLSNRLEHTVESLIPSVPDRPIGIGLSAGTAAVEWNEVRGAESYEVQLRHVGQWTGLPSEGMEISFEGAGAIVTGLPASDDYYFRVRALNSHGASYWSGQLSVPTKLDWESELTAGQLTDVFPAESGYADFGSLGGTLSPDRFVLEGTTHTVKFLVHSRESLWLGIDPQLPADFLLRVGDSIYRGSESAVPLNMAAAGGYWWPSAVPDWPEDGPVRVGLAIHPDIPIGDRHKAPVTAYFRNVPSENDGRESFSFRLHFSEDVTTTAEALRDHVLSVSGGTVSGVEAVRGEGRIWAVSVTPDYLEPVTFEIEPGLDCALPGAICTEDGRRLYNHLVLTVEPVEHHPATGVPTISGEIEVGHTLTADTSSIADGDGMTGATLGYQWVSYDGHAHTDIHGATDSTYTLVPADEGKAFRVRVSFTDDAGFDESLTSALARSERPYGLDASESDGAVVLTWKLPAGWSDGLTFQILRNRPEQGETEPLVHVRYFQDGGNSYTDTDVEPGVLYVYRVKGMDPFGYTGEASRPFEFRTAAPSTDTSDAPPDTSQSATRGSRPNVVLILSDDLGWGDVETNNPESAMTTPHIDSIAAAGAYFTDAHSPSSMCSPTRYGLLTGRYAWRTWLTEHVLGGHSRPMIGSGQPTLGTLFQGHAYRTAAIGKWHLGMDFARHSDIDEVNDLNQGVDFASEIVDGPLDHGFDEFFGTSANISWEPRTYIRDRRFTVNPDTDGRHAPGFYEFHEVLDDLTEEAVSFIERQGETEEPFFLYLPLPVPHVPLSPNAHFAGQTGLGRYADFVAHLDWTVGRVLDALEQVQAYDDTLVIFTSDNGSTEDGIPVPNHADHLSNGMWRGEKGHIFEGGHRVPLLMQWPGEIEAGSTVDATVSLTDIYATLADILGEEPQPGVAIDSVSLMPLMQGEDWTRGTPVVHHSRNGMFALRDGSWKLVFGNGNGGDNEDFSGVPFGTPWRLFDLEQDPGETRNVAGNHPEVMARMEAALESIRAAEDGTLSDDATLKSLSIAGVNIGEFAPGVRTYTGTVPRSVEYVRVAAIPTVTDAAVDIRNDGGENDHGRTSIRFREPSTSIKVHVTSPDKSATATYTVTVTRDVAIAGIPFIGQTLTADTSGITDPDGLTNPTFSYQWVRRAGAVDRHIVGATGATYELTTQDLGNTILVEVSFTDDSGNAETRTSSATATVRILNNLLLWESNLTAAQHIGTLPVISGYLDEGELGGLSPDGWQFDGTHYTVKLLFHSSEGLVLGMDEQLPADFTLHVGDSTYRGSESMAPAAKAEAGYWWPLATPDWSTNEPIEIKLVIHYGVPLGERPRAPVTGYFRNHPPEHDGRDDFTFHIHFSEGVTATSEALRDNVLSVTGGTVSSVEHVRGEGIIWAVSVTPDSLDPVTVEIEPGLDCALPGAICTTDGRPLFNRMELKVPMKPNSPAKGKPTIIGTVEAGETLTADTSAIADADGMSTAAFTYQWVSYDGTIETDIQGETGPTYTLGPADEGKAFRVRVSFTDDISYEETLTSSLASSGRPYDLDASESNGSVILTWRLPAGWSFGSTFQVLRNRPELGETEPLVHVRYLQGGGNSYTDTDVEPGVLYVYRVKGVDPFGYTGEASAPIEIRTAAAPTVDEPAQESSNNSPATGPPSIRGTARVGVDLRASLSNLDDADGLSGATFSYQWLADGTDIPGATGSTYSPVAGDEGKTITVRVSFTDDEGNEESLTSEPTEPVAS